MVSEPPQRRSFSLSCAVVLILVLVEDGLGVMYNMSEYVCIYTVLILVLVEDGLGEGGLMSWGYNMLLVLILVLVEDGLGAIGGNRCGFPNKRLNPCFSGGWSRRRGN